MARAIHIKNHFSEQVGEISFVEDPRNLNGSRTASGFTLSFPARLSLFIVAQNEPIPLINNLTGRLFANDAGSGMEIGSLEHDGWHSSGWTEKPGWGDPTDIHFIWRGTLTELIFFENLRAGRSPQFQVQLRGELSYLLPSGHSRYQVRAHPHLIYGDTEINFPKETWVRELRRIGAVDTVLVEVPLRTAPPAPWDRVWENLVKARDAFEQGGLSGWTGCVLAVRQALEKWREMEGQEPIPSDPRQRSKRERLTNLRHALHQCTHIWIHDRDECSREDAVLMLSTLSALLAERKP